MENGYNGEQKGEMMKRKKWTMLALATIYMMFVLQYAVFNRGLRIQYGRTVLFSSYAVWLQGNRGEGIAILANIVLFMPMGFFFTYFTEGKKHGFAKAVSLGFLCSLLIEFLQVAFTKGMFEADDLLNNSLGTALGYLISVWLERHLLSHLHPKVSSVLITLAGIMFATIGAYEALVNIKIDIFNSQRFFCFEVEDASVHGGSYELTGFAFMPEKELPQRDFTLFLKSMDTGKMIQMKTEYGIERDDVEEYFQCGEDDIHSGFCAIVDMSDIDKKQEYEVYVKYGWMFPIPSGVYVTLDDIHFLPEEDISEPKVAGTDLEEIVNEGTLLFCDPNQSCYVYQHDWSLYWLASKDFPFGKTDGYTLIEYHVWTTQVENLPEDRRLLDLDFDWISRNFEEYEISDTMNCGLYRVYQRDLPRDYSVLSVFTGCRNENGLAWSGYFRPVYTSMLKGSQGG